jgi:ribonuclease HII
VKDVARLHVFASVVLCAKQLPQTLFNPPSGDNFTIERNLQQQGYSVVAGLDEVGRGPLAGPVVAAAVVLPAICQHSLFLDSKVLSAKSREQLFDNLHAIDASIGIGVVSHKTIDKINILQASLLAMKRAVLELEKAGFIPQFLLVDGKFPIPMTTPQEPLVKGESRSASIAAASIIAKVTRDAMMAKLHHQYPHYNFIKNKGYPTLEHRNAIKTHGITPHHRKSFNGVVNRSV